MAGCVFCDIIAGTVPAYVVYDDDRTIAFLDHRPLRPGHVLLVPKQHYETLGELPTDEVGPLFAQAQRLSRAVQKALAGDGSFVAVNTRISQSVPHLHVHVVPRRKGDGLFGRDFVWMRRPYPSEQVMAETQQAVRSALAGLAR